jgi:phosphonate transport system permease protein
MALMAATLGAILAMPLAFLGARNLMPRTVLGNAAYYGSRTFMNVARAIEPLILAAVFAAWVGYGAPFAGVLALVIVTMANLGKLFSEAVENIDPGPMEALQASGASRAQVIRYGVVPQIVPPFLAFGIYFWDIDVRMSTILGFVGAGGIGFVLNEWMRLTQWSWAAVAILGIVIVVTVMDTLSARVRERLV